MASPDGHVLCHGTKVQRICIKADQGTTGKRLGTIVRRPNGGEADLRMSLDHDGRSSYDGRVHRLHKVSLFLAERGEQALGAVHALTHAYAWQGGGHPLACPVPPPCKCRTASVRSSGMAPHRSCYNVPADCGVRSCHFVPRAGTARCSSVDCESTQGPLPGCPHHAVRSRRPHRVAGDHAARPDRPHIHKKRKIFLPCR